MVNKLYKELSVQNLANSIRNKTGKTNKMTLEQMAIEVDSLKPLGSLDGLNNGYDVMFYDENYSGLAFYSIKAGHTIQNPPLYVCDYWVYENGVPVVFPITPTEDIIMYAHFTDLVAELYDFYKIDSVLYPYLAVQVTQSSVPKDTIIIYFGKTLSDESNGIFLYEAMWGYNSRLSSELENIDLNDMNAVISLAMNKIPSLEQTPVSSIIPQYALYTNFSHSKTATEVTLRLDRH